MQPPCRFGARSSRGRPWGTLTQPRTVVVPRNLVMNRAALVALLVAVVVSCPCPAAEPEPTPQQVFERRILPIFKSPEPSSCLQCHLAGVDLKTYILPSHEKTFAS